MKKTLENAESQRIFELLDSQDWPLATDPTQICDENSAEDKIERAQGIIEVCVNKNLKDLVVLDYGCGEGYVAYEAAQQGAAMAIGYDMESNSNSVVPFLQGLGLSSRFVPLEELDILHRTSACMGP